MKEMVSFHDDVEKRLGIFLGLGAFLLSSLFAFFQGLSPEAFLLRGVVVLVLFSLLGWGFGAWFRCTVEATRAEEELPANLERRSRNAESLDEGTLVLPGLNETVVMEEAPATGQVVNFTLPELSPLDAPLPPPPVLKAVPLAAAVAPAAPVDEGDLPPPAVPSWLK